MDRLTARFAAGDAAFRGALRRERVRSDLVDARLQYTGVSWTLHVTCAAAGYRRAVQLPPEDLRVDTAWTELCDAIAEEIAARLSTQPGAVPQP